MNDINKLRDHLFDTLDALKSEESPMDIKRAEAIAGVAQTIINSAKAETERMRVTGLETDSGFMPTPKMRRIPQPGEDDRALRKLGRVK